MDRRDSIKSLLIGSIAGGHVLSGCAPETKEPELNSAENAGYGRTPEEQARDSQRGTVYLGLARNGRTEAEEVRLPGDRSRVRQYAVISQLNFLRRRLLSQDKPEAYM